MANHRAAGPPTAGVAGLVLRGDRALLVRRAGEPNRGRWSLPGGGVERGERIRDAVVREMREETGLEVRPVRLIDVVDVIVPASPDPAYHYVVAAFVVDVLGGEARAGSDAAELRWVSRSELRGLDVTEGTQRILELALP